MYATKLGEGQRLCVELSLCPVTYVLAPVPVPKVLRPTASPGLRPPDITTASCAEVTLPVPALHSPVGHVLGSVD